MLQKHTVYTEKSTVLEISTYYAQIFKDKSQAIPKLAVPEL